MDEAIRAEQLTKFYGERRGIEDIDLTVWRGEVFGFLGPNGAGKTTTIRTLLDFIRPTSGRATVLGRDSRAQSIDIHHRVGYLPGELELYDKLTGGEVLDYFASLRGGVDVAYRDELAERFDLDVNVKVGSYSSGNRQKVGLVQAFMHRPELLILDEPTNGLDPLVQLEFANLVGEVVAAGRTVFLSSHILPEVERIADRVGIIRDGRLIVVEEVAGLKERALRKLEIHFATPVPAGEFAGLPSVQGIEARGSVIELTVAGSLDAVIKAAAAYDVHNIVSHEADLEDIFLAMYREPGDG